MNNPNLPATTKQPGLPTPFERDKEMMEGFVRETGIEPFDAYVSEEDPKGLDPRTEAAAEALVAAMSDLRDSELGVDEIRSLILRKIQAMETPDGEGLSVSADVIVEEIEKEIDGEVVLDLPAAEADRNE